MLTHVEPQADFTYDLADDGAGLPARVAIFGADAGVRAGIAADLAGAGFRTLDGGPVSVLLDGPVTLLGDVVLVECAASGALDAASLAGLARLDMRVARSGARLIVATGIEALDDVFAVLDQSAPQILVAPSRAERVLAVGRAMGEAGAARVREMGEEDRVALLRLSQQVEAIAHSLDRMSAPAPVSALGELRREYRGGDPLAPGGAGRAAPGLPEPRMVREIIANRQARALLRWRAVCRSGLGHAARSDRGRGRGRTGLGDLAVHRRRRAGDDGAALAHPDGRKRDFRAGRRSGRSPPRLHRAERTLARGDGGLFREPARTARPCRLRLRAVGVRLSPQGDSAGGR